MSGWEERLEREIREALPDAHCGPEWRSRHAPECRQEDYEEVMSRMSRVRAALSGSTAPLDVEPGDTELAWKVYGIVDRHRAAFPDANRWQRIGRDVSEAVSEHSLRAAASPDPAQGET